MNKNTRYWLIGITAALIIILIAAAASANKSGTKNPPDAQAPSGSNDGTVQIPMKESGESSSGESIGTKADTGHGAHTSADSDALSRYLTEQDSIMMGMMEKMMIRERSGSPSIDFLKGMIPHHEAAVKMAESYLGHGGESQELMSMAQDMIAEQNNELEQMNEMLKAYEKEGRKDEAKEDEYLEKYSEMFSDDYMSHHITPSASRNIDQAFAEGMIEHHKMAVDMGGDILDYTDYEDLKALVDNMLKVQKKEISDMEKFLK